MHESCKQLVKISPSSECVYEANDHGENLKVLKKGINPHLLKRVDDLLTCGIMPKQVYNILRDEFEARIVPTVAQLHNRKKGLVKSSRHMSTVADVKSYLDEKKVR